MNDIESENKTISEDLLAVLLKQEIINLINTSSLSIVRKEEILGNIYMQIKQASDSFIQEQLKQYQSQDKNVKEEDK